ncbi:Alanine--tRNA ligase [Euphorbia peplus]|nr:Alanine--tRNA ligase [Euphorbia peplus]
MDSSLERTKLEYYHDMQKLQSNAAVISFSKGDDGRYALILNSTIFHPQGGGQPADTGFISNGDSSFKFVVLDVRSKDGVVYHYGVTEEDSASEIEIGMNVLLNVDANRRNLNSRLHSAGHLIDGCLLNVGLDHLQAGKGYHFPDGPFVEYKGTIPSSELQSKHQEIEIEANALISRGGMVSVAVLPYEEASNLCGGSLPDYIPKGSTPRIVKLGNFPGCPCGGTHVSDLSEIKSIKVSQIRMKKGITKVSYTVGS